MFDPICALFEPYFAHLAAAYWKFRFPPSGVAINMSPWTLTPTTAIPRTETRKSRIPNRLRGGLARFLYPRSTPLLHTVHGSCCARLGSFLGSFAVQTRVASRSTEKHLEICPPGSYQVVSSRRTELGRVRKRSKCYALGRRARISCTSDPGTIRPLKRGIPLQTPSERHSRRIRW